MVAEVLSGSPYTEGFFGRLRETGIVFMSTKKQRGGQGTGQQKSAKGLGGRTVGKKDNLPKLAGGKRRLGRGKSLGK